MNQFQLLRLRRFAPLFAVQFLGAFNDNVFRFALIIFITFTLSDKFGMDTRSLVVMSGGIFILPFFLFSSLAGQIADKYEKSSVIRRIKFLEIIVMILAALGFWLESAAFLFVVLLQGSPISLPCLLQDLSRYDLILLLDLDEFQ